MRITATVLVGLSVALSLGQSKPLGQGPKVLPVLQGTVRTASSGMVVLDARSGATPNGRQVDISSAAFEDESGKVVGRYALKPNDIVVIVIDPNAPTTWRPTPRPGHPMPMFIRLLPLKALVVERINLSARPWHANR